MMESRIIEYERYHALKVGLTPSNSYLIDSGESNHMVSFKESFTTFTLLGGLSTHIGYETPILAVTRGSIKIHHDDFIPSPTTNKIVEDEEA